MREAVYLAEVRLACKVCGREAAFLKAFSSPSVQSHTFAISVLSRVRIACFSKISKLVSIFVGKSFETKSGTLLFMQALFCKEARIAVAEE